MDVEGWILYGQIKIRALCVRGLETDFLHTD